MATKQIISSRMNLNLSDGYDMDGKEIKRQASYILRENADPNNLLQVAAALASLSQSTLTKILVTDVTNVG
ncbi:DUF1659 domain-containing protein [Halalkalibacter akibai]|uniref:DUF1659 domain-containing protein n=1 Tax=Halalkalibacter akibai (strain ATCC 43226 / DSM 21942 / CIP 109018 / JCM 9157 / 1139) TaxID=1236973 RepID=W4QWF6_HALA3|nr:DUF1659 domain-containing protein [Halalkalibacter akibai]GAE36450.1 hypothetical protein JCM9157_3636 [Halalkalibacter akibai JCM 9157]